jgi:hypothetical protein
MSNGHVTTQPAVPADVLLAHERIRIAAEAAVLAAIDAYRMGQLASLNDILAVFNHATNSLNAMKGGGGGVPVCPWPTVPVGDMCV